MHFDSRHPSPECLRSFRRFEVWRAQVGKVQAHHPVPGPPPVKSQEPPTGTFTVTGPWATHVCTTISAQTINAYRMRKEHRIEACVRNQASSLATTSPDASADRYGLSTVKMWLIPLYRSALPAASGYFLWEKSIQYRPNTRMISDTASGSS